MKFFFFFFFFFTTSSLLFVSLFPISQAQQPYVSNKQLDCYNYNNDTTTNGNVCNGLQTSCNSYLTFRSQPPYDSATSIATLMKAQPSEIARINNISDVVQRIPTNTQIIVPVNCSCSGGLFYQHNTTYTLKTGSETYFTVANNTYQGLTTCQALIKQNPYDSRRLLTGFQLLVPLRCACPTRNQTAKGVKYLLSDLIEWGDKISQIAQTFGVDEQSVLDANELSSSSLIFPFTPILIPLKKEPTKIQPVSAPVSPPPPPQVQLNQPPNQDNSSSSSSKKWIFIGIGIAVALIALIVIGCLLCVCIRRRRRQTRAKPIPPVRVGGGGMDVSHASAYKTESDILSSEGIRVLVESLTVYKLEELQKATGNFGEDHIIKGNVYRGVISGDHAAIKKKTNVSLASIENEILILKQINHSSVIRLSGICVQDEKGSINTYLVYEFAENGSLSDWLYEKRHLTSRLGWKQRVQIAYDVADGLNYLHNYSNPPYIHKDLKSSNILLNGEFRAKITNFELARTLDNLSAIEKEENGDGNEEDGGLQLTRHVVGTRGYMPPEYLENGVVTPKLDVFAFGVMMLELLSGKEDQIVSLSESIKVVLEGENVRENLKAFMDPALENQYPLDSAFSMANLAMNCVARDLNLRPTMTQVFMSLSKILSSSLDWDPSAEELHLSRSLGQGR